MAFRLLSDEHDDFVRDYEFNSGDTLFDLHSYICTDLGYDPDAVSSFFTVGPEWENGKEYTLFDTGESAENAPLPMDTAILGDIVAHVHDRLVYRFDVFGNRCIFIEVTGIYPAEDGTVYPRTVLALGTPPVQFDPDVAAASESIFDEVMSDFDDFGGDELYDDEF